ncbi:MAG: selenide, water dikinase SelD, partial [bacterium]
VPGQYAMGTIRFSVGRMTTEEEIRRAITIITGSYLKIKGIKQEGVQSFPEITFAEEKREKITMPTLKGDNEKKEEKVTEILETISGTRLTEFTRSLGCACKIQPHLLEKILNEIPVTMNKSVLVGIETSDDAAVYRIDEKTAIVQTVDFIPPIVDDPYTYGAIAAANSISDVYAMGAEPLFALGIVSFPATRLPIEVLQQILKGATDKAAEAGISIIGGHSIDDDEPKFGLVVTGRVHPGRILRNSGAKPGDKIILTKPLGTGIITTALKRGIAGPERAAGAIRSMAMLNQRAAAVMNEFPVNGCTDVTGFGLLGHLKTMIEGSSVGAEIWSERVPVFPEAWEYAAAGIVPGGTISNKAFVERITRYEEGVPDLLKIIFADAQTSGGLLITIPENMADTLLMELHTGGVSQAAIIGKIIPGEPGIVVMKR